MPKKTSTSGPRSEATQVALLDAAARLFAQRGFDAVSTRDIATAAGAHPALIGYHFGSKENLYIAVFKAIVDEMTRRLNPLLIGITATLDSASGKRSGSAQAKELLSALCDAMVLTLANPEAKSWAQLIVREQQEPTEAFTLLYDGIMSRVMATMTRLVQVAAPGRTQEEAQLTVLAIIGQMMVYRVARAGVLKHLGWAEIGPTQVTRIQGAVRAQLGLLLR